MKKSVNPFLWIGIALLLTILMIFLINPPWLARVRSMLSLESLSLLADYFRSLGVWAPIISIALMIAQGILAPLPSFVITAANGLAFGIPFGFLISWTGGMAAAIVMFWLARLLGAGFVERVTKQNHLLQQANRYSGKNGFFLIFVARLLPIVSFDFISFLAGLSQITFRSFFVATALGQIPGTILYTLVGHDVANLDEYQTRFLWTSVIIVLLIIIGKVAASRKKK
ncbi:TVP38/TMEM64 family protein [Pseudalkalibacillus hwajinpoensis]|uniref:TVP38/TMEM64 family protein n=1 Tax=Guptibacillus hwajinpoensis TaxID=208199 RepID=UPI001CD7F2F2|nr:TVP38/TMEM64 family protein [Pseudalkalibacillus hwajinpoensis]MCA0991723.1 TVP38/TMEM64 family protein [Pseudalkalibacillus hwajinpoensis]